VQAALEFARGKSRKSPAVPQVYRGLVAHWPAVQRWSLPYLAQRCGELEVALVDGNRERHSTHLRTSTLREYLSSLAQHGQALYLKEFDLLKAAPQLHQDLGYGDIFKPRTVRAVRAWIGPAQASTGLHYDYLDNMAVQLVGRKRFYLVRPGVVERHGFVSKKYDAWAVLADTDAQALQALASQQQHSEEDFLCVDLAPGDVLHIPATWWHEAANLSTSVSLGSFYGSPVPVLVRWAWVQARQQLHRLGWLGAGGCTCHPVGCCTMKSIRSCLRSEFE
jgi:Cupin-like domain